MQMNYDLCLIKEFGGIEPDGTEIKPARFTILGETPGETEAKAFRWARKEALNENGQPLTRDGKPVYAEDKPRWHEWDHLVKGTLQRHDDGTLTFTGHSSKLADEVDLDLANTMVRWEIETRDCPSCR